MNCHPGERQTNRKDQKKFRNTQTQSVIHSDMVVENQSGKEWKAQPTRHRAYRYFLAVAADSAIPGATIGFRNGIMARSFGPSCSIACNCSTLRSARKLGQPFSFSSIQAFAKLPSRISASSFFMASRVSFVTTRGPA